MKQGMRQGGQKRGKGKKREGKKRKGIEEKEQQEGFRAMAEKEFSEELPVLGSITEPISLGNSSRRDFLKMLGLSVTAATIAASCEMPVRKAIPYAIKPATIAFVTSLKHCACIGHLSGPNRAVPAVLNHDRQGV